MKGCQLDRGGGCFNKRDGLSDWVTDRRLMLFVHIKNGPSDGLSWLLKQPPGSSVVNPCSWGGGGGTRVGSSSRDKCDGMRGKDFESVPV